MQFNNQYRKIIAMMSLLFNNIIIENEGKKIQVPLHYAQKTNFLDFINRRGGGSELKISHTVPVMSFEDVALYRDESRGKNKVLMLKKRDGDKSIVSINRVPYKIDFLLYIYTKTKESGARIFEQIIPNFNPSLSVKLKDLEEFDYQTDIEIHLNDINIDHDYLGINDSTRIFVHTLSFTVDMFFYAPTVNEGFIKQAIIDLASDDVENVIANLTLTVDPFEASQDDPHEVIEEYTEDL